jgi:hypothetical protein
MTSGRMTWDSRSQIIPRLSHSVLTSGFGGQRSGTDAGLPQDSGLCSGALPLIREAVPLDTEPSLTLSAPCDLSEGGQPGTRLQDAENSEKQWALLPAPGLTVAYSTCIHSLGRLGTKSSELPSPSDFLRPGIVGSCWN